MSAYLKREHEVVRRAVKKFAEREVAPLVKKMDEENWYPRELIRKLGEQGYMGMLVPAEYGGSEFDSMSYVIAIEELSYYSPALGVFIEVQNSLAGETLAKYGTGEQKEKYLPKLASGEWTAAYALTEPGAGSDAAAVRTKAEKRGDHYVINGSKIFITNGAYADFVIVYARTGRLEDRHRGITAFIVDKDTPGFKVASKIDIMGIRGTGTAELLFEDVEVPEENVLGEINKGFYIAMDALNSGRLAIAAVSVGLARRAYDESLRFATQRKAFDKLIIEHEGVGFKLADMVTEIEAAKLMVYHTAYLRDKGASYYKEAAMAKLFASEVAVRVAREAVQIHGGIGYSKESIVEMLYRDAKLMEIGEGTSEILRLVVYRALMKEMGVKPTRR